MLKKHNKVFYFILFQIINKNQIEVYLTKLQFKLQVYVNIIQYTSYFQVIVSWSALFNKKKNCKNNFNEMPRAWMLNLQTN